MTNGTEDTMARNASSAVPSEALGGTLALFVGSRVTLILGIWVSSSIVVMAIINSRKTREQYLYWFLLNLSVSTIMSGFVHPTILASSFRSFLATGQFGLTDPNVCLSANLLLSINRSISCSSSFLMSLERYLTIRNPLTHCYLLTRRRILLAIGGSWIVALAFTGGHLVHWAVFDVPLEVRFCNPELFKMWRVNAAQVCFEVVLDVSILGIYLHLHVIAQRHLRVIEEERRYFGLVQYQRNIRRSNVALRISLFILSFEIPMFAISVYTWTGTGRVEGEKYAKASVLLLTVSQVFQPLFYSLLSPDFRNSLRSLFGRNRIAPERVVEIGAGRKGAS